jgi:tetratricopeptide (TPR) repeat protein
MHSFFALPRRPAFRYVWFLFLLAGPLYGQSSLIDSLEKRLTETHLPDTLRIDRLNILAREYTYISATKATRYAQEVLEWSTRIGYKRGQAYAFRNLASSYSAQEYFYSTTEFMEKAITIFEELGDSVGMANCYITLGHTYKRQQDLPQSIVFHAKAVGVFRQQGLDERLGVSLHNLGESQFLAATWPPPNAAPAKPWPSTSRWATRRCSRPATR